MIKLKSILTNLQKLFVPNPPTDKEIEMYKKVNCLLTLYDFKQLTFEELEYYLSIRNSLTREELEHIATLPRAKELIRRYAVISIGKNLTREIADKYLSLSDKKQLANNIGAEINSQGEIIYGDIYVHHLSSLDDFPFKIKKVNNIDCSLNKLTSLKGSPEYVDGNFICSSNKLTSLEGSPEYVNGNFFCSYNELTSLEGSPKEVGENFNCMNNLLTTLEGSPEKVGGIFCCQYNKLTSLRGAPEKINGSFDCYNNLLTSLEGAPEYVGKNFLCYDNLLTTLEGAPKEVGGNFICKHNGKKFTEEEVRAVCDVKGRVVV